MGIGFGDDDDDIYAIGFSSWMVGVVGAVVLVELAKSLKFCTEPERDADTFV